MKYLVRIIAIIGTGSMLSCSPSQTARFMNQEYDDDIYFVSSGRSEMYVEESRKAVRESDGQPDDAYNEYLNARRGNNSGVSPYGYSERSYDRTMQRHADPMWSDPSFGMGMGGFYGMRSYMLYNPYYPPFWSMQPGLSLSFNSMGGFGMGYGMGMGMGMNPYGFGGGFGGMHSPFYDPFMMGGMGMYNPYMGWGNPYMGWGNPYMGWHNPHHMNPWVGGGGWAGGGDFSGGTRLPVAPPRSGNVGGGTPRQSSLFNPNPGRNTAVGGTSNRIDNGGRMATPSDSRMAPGTAPSRGNTVTPNRETGNSGRRIIEESRPTRTPSRNTWDRGSSPASPSRTPDRVTPGGGGTTPSRGGGSFDRGGSTVTPSRGGDSGGSVSPSRGGGGGGGSRPSGGTSPGRPR
jgi:hypothetical protein